MNKVFISLALTAAIVSVAHASQSTIVDSEGYGCMGEDRSRKQTEQAAVADAKKNAVDRAATYISSETRVENFVLQKDVVEAYQHATVKVLEEIEKTWYKDEKLGECCRLKIKAEVRPDEKAIAAVSGNPETGDDPSAPLSVRVWTDRKEYKAGQKIKVYLRGNKPFFARVIYKDASGGMVQLLPNPFRSDNYFQGGTMYELPTGNDRFELEVSPPFGEESIIVYASSSPLGDIDVRAAQGVYEVRTRDEDVGIKTRGVKLVEKGGSGKGAAPAEFVETSAGLRTGK